MRWVDLAFLHWRIPPANLRPLVPGVLELDTFDGDVWVAVTPFLMSNVRPRFLPPVPTAAEFPELNVRTYVRHGGRGGVYFFSLDAASALAVAGARVATALPYHHARMSLVRDGEEISYASSRHGAAAEFRARYRPTGDVFRSAPGSFEHWSTERYSLFVLRAAGTLFRLDIEHEPWPLQPARCIIERNTMFTAAALPSPSTEPRVHFARALDVAAHLPLRSR